jgi:hypothetical protein
MADNDVLIEVETVVGMLTSEDPLDADGIRFLLDALTAATDDALSFLSARIECHTAQGRHTTQGHHTTQGGAVQAQLSALRPQARSREEKAAVALIAARATEGAGDSATARDLLDEALTLRRRTRRLRHS